jgi:hypothetical protein
MVVSTRSTASSTTAAPSVEELLAAIQASARTNPTLARIKIQALGNRETISSQHGNSIHKALDEVFNANKTSNGLVVIKAVNNLAKNNPQLFTRKQLQQWVGKSLAILNDRFSAQDKKSASLTLINDCWDAVTPSQVPVVTGKAIELIDATTEVSGAALTLINDRWDAINPSQQQDLLTKSIALVQPPKKGDVVKQSYFLVKSAALHLLTNRLPQDHSKRGGTANLALRILLESDNQFILTAAANFVTQHLVKSELEQPEKVCALTRLAGMFKEDDNFKTIAAIFDAGLESVRGVAGVTISPPSPMPSRSHGYCAHTWPVRAADSHQPATNPAALARAALERPPR